MPFRASQRGYDLLLYRQERKRLRAVEKAARLAMQEARARARCYPASSFAEALMEEEKRSA
jgi:hypothetical protein